MEVRGRSHRRLRTCASHWMWLVVNLRDMSEEAPFDFRRSRRWMLTRPHSATVFLRERRETRVGVGAASGGEPQRSPEQTDRTLQTLEPCGKLGK